MVTGSLRLQNACKVLAGIDTLLTHPLRGDAQSRCKHFTSVSPDRSGHFPPTVGAPMLSRSPLAGMVSSKQAPTRELWNCAKGVGVRQTQPQGKPLSRSFPGTHLSSE